ncbi:hypothetical protein COLO4_16054 [Corchorus olitorius]|uniref:Uncharacterized protein n=1 Tax=Corchorus olitorius TaxID=93759 RepID=A0A1R3JK04_9ROSI|nr:hypothetical protein COLO4_16054 [Corchorus olitorius]
MASPPSKPSPELSSALGSRGMVRRAILSPNLVWISSKPH